MLVLDSRSRLFSWTVYRYRGSVAGYHQLNENFTRLYGQTFLKIKLQPWENIYFKIMCAELYLLNKDEMKKHILGNGLF